MNPLMRTSVSPGVDEICLEEVNRIDLPGNLQSRIRNVNDTGTSDAERSRVVRWHGAKRFGVRAALRRFASALPSREADFLLSAVKTGLWWIKKHVVLPERYPKAAGGRRTPKRFARAFLAHIDLIVKTIAVSVAIFTSVFNAVGAPAAGTLAASLPFPIPARFKAGEGNRSASSKKLAAAWWSIFQDSTLDDLEHSACFSNQDLRLALARVDEARAQTRTAAADFFPTLTAPLRAARQRTTGNGPVMRSRLAGIGPFSTGAVTGSQPSFEAQVLSSTFNDFQAPLELSYEIDLFGRIRHAYGQARAITAASEAERQAVELGLTAQVAANYFALRAVDSQVAVLQRTLRLRGDSLEIQRQRAKIGATGDVDVLRAQVEEANTEAELDEAVRQRAQLENAVAVLCGRPASDFQMAAQPLEHTRLPTVPATIPAQLLARRPDLIEAERRIAAASESIKAARAQFYPRFNLLANYGYESAEFSELAKDDSRVWSIAGAISIPIFEGGRTTARVGAAKSQAEEALAAYRQTALTAFREAEDALSALRQRTLQASARERASKDSRRVFDALQQTYLQGGINYLDVIDAQRVLLSAELAEVDTLHARYAATIDLIRAMGGSYRQ